MMINGTFQSMWRCYDWCKENGYRYGSLCTPWLEIPLQKGTEYTLPQKIKNFSPDEKKLIDGILLSDDFRNGPVHILIFDK